VNIIRRLLVENSCWVRFDARVKNVTLERLRLPPYRAHFEKVYYAPIASSEVLREAVASRS
jgi:hypothetical protein